MYTSLHHEVRVKTLLYQNLQQRHKTKELKLFSKCLSASKSQQSMALSSFLHLHNLYTKTRTKSKSTGHSLSQKPRIKQGLTSTKTSNQVNPGKPKPWGFCRPWWPTIKCPIRDWTRMNYHGVSKAYPWANGCPILTPTTRKDKSLPV